MSLAAGNLAPAFDLPATGNRRVRSADLAGKPYVLYFYPKADTPGCTREGQAFQAALSEFNAACAAVIGVSRDPVPALEKFAAKYGFAFPLASDEHGKLTEAYGVWTEKSMYGKKYLGIERATFLIGPDGRIARAWPKMKVDGHAAEVLAELA